MNKFYWGYYQRKILLEYSIRKEYLSVEEAKKIMYNENNRRGLLEEKLNNGEKEV